MTLEEEGHPYPSKLPQADVREFKTFDKAFDAVAITLR